MFHIVIILPTSLPPLPLQDVVFNCIFLCKEFPFTKNCGITASEEYSPFCSFPSVCQSDASILDVSRAHFYPRLQVHLFTGVSVQTFSQLLVSLVLVPPLSPVVLVCTSKYWTLSFQLRGGTPVWCLSLASFIQAITYKNYCLSFCCVCRQMKLNISVQAPNYL